MSILLTGAAGMIGSVVLRDLEARGLSVWTTDLRPLERQQHVIADLSAPDEVARLTEIDFDAVIHLSGVLAGHPSDLFTSNVLGTVRLLDGLPRSSRIVMAGSAAEYGPGEGNPISESDPLRPVSPYGWAKVAQSSVARSIADRRGHHLTVVRPFNVAAPGLPTTTALGNMRAQLGGADPGGAISVGRLDVIRDYVPVDFVASVISATAADPSAPSAVNACSGIGLQLHDVLDAMIALLDIEIEIAADPHLAQLSAAPVVIGNPSVAADLYGLATRPDASSIARLALGIPTE
jgi:nucleoside-diphosphate-sugar epimerase